MSELLKIFYTYPPSVPSRCRQSLPRSPLICPPCPALGPGPICPGKSKVQYQLTYTCNRSTYQPCYSPAIPSCPPAPPPPPPPMRCELEFVDCCGRPVCRK